jgi:hypothetical protein
MNDRKGLTQEQVCDRGQRLLEEKLSSEEVDRRRGQMAAVDVVSGEIGFGRTGIEADDELRRRVSEPVTYLGRVGFPTAYRLGWGGAKFKVEAREVESTTAKPVFEK